jgi:uncharacterized protein YutE (UPF0331/DUF86 family)
MVPLNKEQKETALKRITFVERELKDLEEYKDLEFTQYETDRKTRRNVERILENIMNASADIAKVLLAGEDVGMPATYREVIIKLGELQILKKEVASTLADFMRLRNIAEFTLIFGS